MDGCDSSLHKYNFSLMQTFLPFPDYEKSAQCLDNKRLGKQRVECLQILNVLTSKKEKVAWQNHPAVKMWKGFEPALLDYTRAVCLEWKSRGFNDTVYDKVNNLFKFNDENKLLPHWFGKEIFHASHRANLLRKNPIWYGILGWKESSDMEYWWPTKNGF